MNKKTDFIWFGNDADGLSIIDMLAAGIFLYYILMKVAHLVLSIVFFDKPDLIIQMNSIMDDVNTNMNVVLGAYFIKKTVDTTITKVGLFKSGQYTQPVSNNTTTSEEQVIINEVTNTVAGSQKPTEETTGTISNT